MRGAHDAAVLLAARRLLCLSACFCAGLAAGLLLGAASRDPRAAVARLWARSLLWALGVRLHVAGEAPRGPALLVANHVSWLDVLAIAAVQPATFVCKSEIATWPAIGWLLRRADTVFIRRRSLRDILRVNAELRTRFAAGESIAVFPEGTTTDGSLTLPFRPALFQPAVERALPVQPVMLAYSGDQAVYVGDTSFGTSLLAIARAPRLEIHMAFVACDAAPGLGRKHAARAAREAVAVSLLHARQCQACGQEAAQKDSSGFADSGVVDDLGAADAVRQA